MKSRATLMLLEQLLMLLVFSLAAALCLRCFVRASEIQKETARRDEAVLIAQNAAEMLKAGEDLETMLTDSEYRLKVLDVPEDVQGFRKAEILVLYGEDLLFRLTTGWQEANG